MDPQETPAILTFHKIEAVSQFEKQMKFLQGKRDVLITVDDGDVSFYEHAFPIIERFKIPSILFIITELINTKMPFWWDEVIYHLGSEKGQNEVRRLKTIPNQDRIKRIEEIRNNSDRDPLIYKQLTTAQLQEMNNAGVVIANHSHTHPMFDKITSQEIRDEMTKSREFFEKLGFGRYDWFAYPNGNYTEESEAVLSECGITKAFLFDHRRNGGDHAKRISRLSVNDNTPLWKLKLIKSGIHSNLVPVTRRIHKLLS